MLAITPETQPTTTAIPTPTFGADFEILRDALAIAHRQQPQHGKRLDRAATIVAIRRIEPTEGGYLVESETEADHWYLVTGNAFGARCMCHDYQARGGLLCKHILATKLLALCERLAARRAPEPTPLPQRAYTDADRFVLTPQGEAALAALTPTA